MSGQAADVCSWSLLKWWLGRENPWRWETQEAVGGALCWSSWRQGLAHGKRDVKGSPALSITHPLTIVLCFYAGSGLLQIHASPPQPKLGCSRNALLSLQAVSAQPAAAVSLGLSSKPWVPACLYQRMWISGWSIQGTGISPLCMVLSVLPVVDWLLGSPWSLWSSLSVQEPDHPASKGASCVQGPLLFFDFLPGVQVPSHVLFSSFCFILPSPKEIFLVLS